MKHVPNTETNWRLFLVLLVLPLAARAQVFDTTPPKIAHQPVRLGRVGKTLPILANVSDNTGVKSVRITIQHDGEQIQHEMNPVADAASVPVVVQTGSESVALYATPGATTLLKDAKHPPHASFNLRIEWCFFRSQSRKPSRSVLLYCSLGGNHHSIPGM